MELIYPLFAMVVLTAVVGVLTAFNRIRSAKTGEVDPRYFRLMANYPISDRVAKYGRNFDNLFEVPVLFYAVGVLAIAVNSVNGLMVTLAWVFVGLRVLHTLIHLTYNHPLHRFAPFFLSFVCVLVMWIDLVVAVGSAT